MSVFQTENRLVLIKLNTGGKESCQTIEKKIRVVSRAVNRHQAVKVIKEVGTKPVADKVNSRAASRVANKAVNRTGKSNSVKRGEFGQE
jgi:hypothetical protein